MLRRVSVALVILLLSAACTVDGTSTTQTTESAAEPTGVGGLPGRLVVLDSEGNVVTIDPDGTNPSPITGDAGDTARYSQPSWSPQSDRVAWAEITETGFGVSLSGPDGQDPKTITMSAPPFYLYWSPDGEAIGVLHNGLQGDIEFEMIDVAAATTSILASGTPFYFSWSPESDRVVVHVRQTIFGILDLEGEPTDLGATGETYQSPHWTPSGIFHLGVDGLEVKDPSGEARVLATATGSIALVANHQGSRVAVQSFVGQDDGGISVALSQTPALPTNAVAVVDVVTGEVSEVTSSPSIGFFWSPDGESLLVLEPTGDGVETEVLVWNDGTTRSLSTITPEPGFVSEVLQFFDQYSQSLRLWSPDSSAVVLVGAIDSQPGIWVQDVASGGPVKVFDGSWAVWSNG